MIIQLLLVNKEDMQIQDLSHLVTEVQWETHLEGFPGKLAFSYIDNPDIIINEGSMVSFKVDEHDVFLGFVFTKNKTKDEKVTITAYDQLRYLKNPDTKVLEQMTASQIFMYICKDFQLKGKVIHESSYVVPPKVHDNITLFEILDHGLTETLINANKWYIIRDNFGTLEFVDLEALKTNIYVGDADHLIDFTFEGSIDKDTYNRVRLLKESSQTKRREIYEVFDSESMFNWGVLQYFEKFDDLANEAQLSERAELLLRMKNRPTRTLKLKLFGNMNLFAGCGIIINVDSLREDNFTNHNNFIIKTCTHIFINDVHTMELEILRP